MNTPPVVGRRRAPRRFTSATLSVGVAVAGVCFVIAAVAELAGVATGSGSMTDLDAILDGLLTFTPWAWAALGTYVVVLTPVVALLVTAGEYASVDDRRTVATAIAVFAVLGISALVAILR